MVDGQTPAGSLTVTQIAGGSANGIVIGPVMNTAGTVNATVSASCTATSGTVRFQVSDGSLASTGDLQVNVTQNALPTVGSYANSSVAQGQNLTVAPSAAPADNGSVVSINASILPINFTGTLTPAIATGNVVIGNAAPVGTYTVAVQVTDNCSANNTASFTMNVLPNDVFANGFE